MRIELRPLDSITPYDKNPRVNDGAVEAVAPSVPALLRTDARRGDLLLLETCACTGVRVVAIDAATS